jgi:hypothetical protein
MCTESKIIRVPVSYEEPFKSKLEWFASSKKGKPLNISISNVSQVYAEKFMTGLGVTTICFRNYTISYF